MPLFPTTTPNKTTPLVTDRVLLSSTPDGGEAMDASFQEILDALNIALNSEVVHNTGNESIDGTKTFSDIDVAVSGATGIFPLILENLSTANVSTKYISFSVYGRDTVNTQKPVGSMVIAPVDGNWVNSYMALYTRTADVNTEKVRIDQLGNVGMGTTAPLRRLHVQGGVVSQSVIRISETLDTADTHYSGLELYDGATFKGGIFKNGLSHDLSLWTTSKALTVLASNNNIGIGNAAPTEKLDVTGNMKSSGTIEAANTSGFKLGASANIVFNTTSSSIDFIIN